MDNFITLSSLISLPYDIPPIEFTDNQDSLVTCVDKRCSDFLENFAQSPILSENIACFHLAHVVPKHLKLNKNNTVVLTKKGFSGIAEKLMWIQKNYALENNQSFFATSLELITNRKKGFLFCISFDELPQNNSEIFEIVNIHLPNFKKLYSSDLSELSLIDFSLFKSHELNKHDIFNGYVKETDDVKKYTNLLNEESFKRHNLIVKEVEKAYNSNLILQQIWNDVEKCVKFVSHIATSLGYISNYSNYSAQQ